MCKKRGSKDGLKTAAQKLVRTSFVVVGPHADLREVGYPSRIEGPGVLQRVEHVGVLRGELRRQGAVNPEDEVLRGERIAVAPTRAVPQVKPPDQSVGRGLPAFGEGGNGL